MVWRVKDFDEHRQEWLDEPTMPKQEVLNYLGISDKQLKKLEKLGWIGKVYYPHGNRWKLSYDRFEIIAFAHEVGLRT